MSEQTPRIIEDGRNLTEADAQRAGLRVEAGKSDDLPLNNPQVVATIMNTQLGETLAQYGFTTIRAS